MKRQPLSKRFPVGSTVKSSANSVYLYRVIKAARGKLTVRAIVERGQGDEYTCSANLFTLVQP